jgi:hypothetical protein
MSSLKNYPTNIIFLFAAWFEEHTPQFFSKTTTAIRYDCPASTIPEKGK